MHTCLEQNKNALMITNMCKNMFKQEKYLDNYQKGNISFNEKW